MAGSHKYLGQALPNLAAGKGCRIYHYKFNALTCRHVKFRNGHENHLNVKMGVGVLNCWIHSRREMENRRALYPWEKNVW